MPIPYIPAPMKFALPLLTFAAFSSNAFAVDCEKIYSTNVPLPLFYETNSTYTDKVVRNDWPLSTPQAEGMSETQLEIAAGYMQNNRDARSLLVVRNGKLVFERYFHGATLQSSNNIHSASKSILSAAVGIALEQKKLKSLDQELGDLLPAYLGGGLHGAKSQITLRHLLTMRSGIDWVEDSTEWSIGVSKDWVGAILSLPQKHSPGKVFNYSTGDSHLLSAVLTQNTGMSTCEFVHKNLFDPLGITAEHWGRDPQKVYSGGYNLYLTPREMAKFGQLFLQNGEWNGKQIVPKAWVRESMRIQTFDGTERKYGYGYNWWRQNVTAGEVPVAYAWGHGGQYIWVVKKYNLVVVVTANTFLKGEDLNLQPALEDFVLPAVVR
jgi:CubicO group peptidase (beta-lactamase class C family)